MNLSWNSGRVSIARSGTGNLAMAPLTIWRASEALGHFQCAGGGIRAIPGISQNGEVDERELICECDYIGWPVPYLPAALELRAPESRPIWDNHTDVEFVCQRLATKQTPFQPATWRAVEIKDWSSIRDAIFVIGKQTATWQAKLLVDLSHDLLVCLLPA